MRTKNLKNTKRKEELILTAAERCFLTKGFHKTTMRDIATEADISLGSIYQYFKGKHDITLKFIEISNQETRDAINYITSSNDFKKALRDVLYLLLDDFVKNKKLIIYLEILSEALKNEEVKAIITQEKTEAYFADLLAQAEVDKKIGLKIPALATSHLLLSAVETAATNMMMHNKQHSKKEARHYILQIINLVLD